MDKKKQIEELIELARVSLEEARELSVGVMTDSGNYSYPAHFYFDGPAYGMGGSLENGEWSASSHSC